MDSIAYLIIPEDHLDTFLDELFNSIPLSLASNNSYRLSFKDFIQKEPLSSVKTPNGLISAFKIPKNELLDFYLTKIEDPIIKELNNSLSEKGYLELVVNEDGEIYYEPTEKAMTLFNRIKKKNPHQYYLLNYIENNMPSLTTFIDIAETLPFSDPDGEEGYDFDPDDEY